MRQPATASLLHDLVVGSHAEGTTRLAVAVLIEADAQILLVESNRIDAFDSTWEPPSDLVLPGETLTDAVHRTAAVAGIDIGHIASYLGHRDLLVADDLVRTFVFAATIRPGHACCPTAHAPYRWTDIDDLPDGLDGDTLAFIHAPPFNVDDTDHAQRLCDGLRSHARGLLATEAAIELLIGHRCWLRRTDFTNGYLDTVPALLTSMPMTCADWPAAIAALDAGALPCSGSEGQMLRIAASLAEGIPVDLRDALTRLDSANLDLVVQAVLHMARPLASTPPRSSALHGFDDLPPKGAFRQF